MQTNVGPERQKRAGCGWLATLIAAIFIGFFAFLVVPASHRLTQPVLCPDAESTLVTTSTTHNAKGESSTTAKLYCIDAENRAYPQNMLFVFLVLVGEAALLLIVLAVLRSLGARLRGEDT